MTLVKGEQLLVHMRFKGGATETIRLERPKASWELRQTDVEVVRIIDELLGECTDAEVAERLNTRGLRSGWGKAFSRSIVKRMRHSYGLKSYYDRLRERGMLTPEELARRLGVSRCTVVTWRRWGLLKAQRCTDNGRYLYEIPGDDLPAKFAHKRRYRGELTS